jgi:hypothetical protein
MSQWQIGRKMSKEAKIKMSKSKIGKPAHNKGSIHTEETKKKISEKCKGRISPNKGKLMSSEQKQKISTSHKRKYIIKIINILQQLINHI